MSQPPLQWPLEYYEGRPLCRCSNEQCSLAQRGLAYTWLDVHTAKSLCGGCDQEFEYLESNCTYASNRAAKGLSAKGKGKGKGKQQHVNIFISGKAKSKGKAKGYESSYYIGEKGKGNGANIGNDRNSLFNLLDTFGVDIISPEQSNRIKVALETYGTAQHVGPIYPASPLTESQELKQQLKHYDSKLSMQDNQVKQAKEKYCKLAYELKDQMDRVTQLVDDRTQLCDERAEIHAKISKLAEEETKQADETYNAAISNMQDITDLAQRMSDSTAAGVKAEPSSGAEAAVSKPLEEEEDDDTAEAVESTSKDDVNGSNPGPHPDDDDREDPYSKCMILPSTDENMGPSAKRAADNISSTVPPIGSIASSIQAYEDAAARKKTRGTPRSGEAGTGIETIHIPADNQE